MRKSIGKRLEQYTMEHPEEVLRVLAEIEGEPEEILIFKGFSSSLTRPTAFELEVPVLPETAKIISIDRLASPYNSEQPHYIQQELSWFVMEKLL